MRHGACVDLSAQSDRGRGLCVCVCARARVCVCVLQVVMVMVMAVGVWIRYLTRKCATCKRSGASYDETPNI